MFPKEHGAYGQLLFPIATALAIGRPGVTAAAMSGAALFAFLAHEPLLVLLGQRGPRAARELHQRATAWFSTFAALAAVCATVALYTASPSARAALAAPVIFALFLAAAIVTGREHTVAGEVMSALALSSIAYPIGISASASSRASLSCAAAFAATFVVGVVCVHGVIGFTRRPPALLARATGALAAVGSLVVCYGFASNGTLEAITPIAVAPASIAGIGLVAFPPSARKLRIVGWTLVAISVCAAAALIAAFR